MTPDSSRTADEARELGLSCGFMPAAGSSSSSTFGSVASARAISSRRWSPYGRLPALLVDAGAASPQYVEQLARALACSRAPRA